MYFEPDKIAKWSGGDHSEKVQAILRELSRGAYKFRSVDGIMEQLRGTNVAAVGRRLERLVTDGVAVRKTSQTSGFVYGLA